MHGCIVALTSLLLQCAFTAHAFPVVPKDPTQFGELCTTEDTDFKEFRYQEQIPYCRRNVERSLKTAIYRAYGIAEECRHRYTIDHFYPLSLGGNNRRGNLWPEHVFVKALRQNLELQLYNQINRGELTQKETLAMIRDAKINPPLADLPESSEPCDQRDKIIADFMQIRWQKVMEFTESKGLPLQD